MKVVEGEQSMSRKENGHCMGVMIPIATHASKTWALGV